MTKKAWHEPIEVGLISVRVMYVELTDYVGWHDIFVVPMFFDSDWTSGLRTGSCQGAMLEHMEAMSNLSAWVRQRRELAQV